jgi:hypothetical protein
LEVENKGRNLLGETKQVDGSVEQTRLKLLLEIASLSETAVSALSATAMKTDLLLDRFRKGSNVDKGSDVYSELQQDRKQDVEIENVAQRTFPAELFDRLGSRDTQETDTHEHTSNGDLVVTKLDTVEVLNGKRIGGDETVEGENLVHLDRGDQGTSALTNDIRD